MKFVVLGAGAWGTAFAVHLARMGQGVTLVPRRLEQALELVSERENKDYLPGVSLPEGLQVAHDLAPVLLEAEVVLLACPSQVVRETCERIKKAMGGARELKFVVSLVKGLEKGTHLRVTEIVEEVLPGLRAAVLSGPTNAEGVAQGLPAAMVLATREVGDGERELQAALSGPSLRVYSSDDCAGVEFAGALKNIYAIAAGICDGLRLGDNARAALLTRSIAEMVRLGKTLGAKEETFYGMSGFGDLLATGTGKWSRNHQLGFAVGEGRSVEELMGKRRTVVEGYRTCEAFADLCRAKELDAPIIFAVEAILFKGAPLSYVVEGLMNRSLKAEKEN